MAIRDLHPMELAARLEIHASTLVSWVKHGIIKAHAYNGHAWLYEEPQNRPAKHCSRWDRLVDRAARNPRINAKGTTTSDQIERGVV